MTHQMNTKVRLVRCPKCQLVLRELPEIPVYKCGGCNTVLQAKHRKPDMKEAGFHYHETDVNGPKEADHVSAYSHLKKDTSISHVEESSARSTTQISDNSENINLKQPQDVVSIPVSPGQNCFEYEESSPEKKKAMELDKDSSISSQDTGQCGNVLGDGNSGWHRGRRASDEISTSMELTSNEMEDSSLELQPCLVTEKGRYDTDQSTEAGEIGYDNGKREHFEGSNFSNDAPFVMTQSSPESGLNKQRGKSVHLSRQDRAGSKIDCHEPEIQPVRREAEREADKLLKVWAYKGLGAEESDSTDDNKSPWDDNILADKVSPDAQYVELPRKLVRCPKCQLVLLELPEIPVYKCGGCNTVLQAKHRKPDTKEAGFQYHETDENGPKEADHGSAYNHLKKDASISHVEESSAPTTTQISDNSENINLKQPQDVVSLPVSPGQNCFEYEDSSPVKKKKMELDKDNSISSQDIGQCGNVLGDGNSSCHRGKRVCGDFSTSMELTSNEMEDSSLELQPVTEKGRYDTGKREYFEGSNFSNDVPFVMTQSCPESGLNKQRGKSVHLSRQDRAGSQIACHEPEIQSDRREAEKLLKVSEESDSTDDNQSPWDENILADKVSPDAQYVVLPRKLVSQDFKHASSADSLSNLPIDKPRFEQGVKRANFSNYPARSYYPCNGSVSSNDGMGDQGPTRTSKPPRRKLKHPASVTSDVPPKQGESCVLKSLRSKIEMHHQGYNRSGVYDPVSHESEANRNTKKHTNNRLSESRLYVRLDRRKVNFLLQQSTLL